MLVPAGRSGAQSRVPLSAGSQSVASFARLSVASTAVPTAPGNSVRIAAPPDTCGRCSVVGILLWAETGWNTVSACEAPHIANMHQESFPGRIPGVAVQIVSAGVLPPPLLGHCQRAGWRHAGPPRPARPDP